MRKFLVFMFISEISLLASSYGPPSNFIPYLFYAQNIAPQDRVFLDDQFRLLLENVKGNELILALQQLINPGQMVLVQSGKEGHAFMPPKSDEAEQILHLQINFEKISKSNPNVSVGGIGGEVIKESGRFYEIGSMLYPFYFVLGHELIHALHFLEDAGQYHDALDGFRKIKVWKLYHNEPNPMRMEYMWNNFEEQRTVIGLPRDDIMEGLSEITLLLAQKRVPRYAYHPSDNHFYEKDDVIHQIFRYHEAYLADLIPGIDSSLIRESWFFDENKAITSNLTPAYLRMIDQQGILEDTVSEEEQENQLKKAKIFADRMKKREEDRLAKSKK
jgi:hypothetical protein